jgi:hypothetical protein
MSKMPKVSSYPIFDKNKYNIALKSFLKHSNHAIYNKKWSENILKQLPPLSPS